MNRSKTFVFAISLLIILMYSSACSRNEGKLNYTANAILMDKPSANESPVPPPPGSSDRNQDSYNPKLVKKGELTISSNSLEATKKTLHTLVKACNGNITNENMVKSDFTTYYEIGLNVQAAYFDKFLQLLDSAELNIVSRSFSVEDITMQYIDDSTRLQNKKKLEKKYLELLSKAADMRSTLDIEAKIEEIRTNIEVKESQLKLLNKQVAYSDFSVRIELDDVNLSKNSKSKFFYRLGKGISNGWYGMKEFLIFLVTIWPVYLFAAAFIYLIRFLVRKRRKNINK